MKAFKFTPLGTVYILFSFLAATTAALAVAPNIILNPGTASVEMGLPFGPYQIVTDTDGTPDAPLLYNAQGLPAGLSLDPSTGVVSGTPTESSAAPFSVTLSATNVDGTGTGTLELTVTDPTPAITSPLAIAVNAGESYTYTITATNNPTSYSVLGLDVMDTDAIDMSNLVATGSFTFTPSVSGVSDPINLLIRASNGAGLTSEVLAVTILPAITPTPPTASVILNTPTSGSLVDYDPDLSATNQITVAASVTPSAGETIDTVFVRWNNPPAKPDGTPRAPIILAQLVNTAGNDYEATVDIGFDPENREIGGGSIDLEVVAYQTNALSTDDFASDSSTFRIDPLLDVLFPDDNLTRGFFDVGDIFASARVGTNDFSKVTARISGPGIVFSSEDDDASDNQNGVHDFDLPQLINLEGIYQVRVEVLDLDGASTVVERQLFITETVGDPVAVILTPTPGFTNEIFSPAYVSYTQSGAPEPQITVIDGVPVVNGFNITYSLTLESGGQGYYPRNETITLPATADTGVTKSVSDVVISNGRVVSLPETTVIFFSEFFEQVDDDNDPDTPDVFVPEPRWGLSGTATLDDLQDPGANGKITITAEFFRANAPLEGYKIFVNGTDVTPLIGNGVGNLNPANGDIDIPVFNYPAVGSPDAGDYVVTAQVIDQNGNIGNAFPQSFKILPYEPLEISLSRQVAAGVDPTDPVLIGGSATFLAQVSNVNEIDEVEFFESNSGDSLGFGSRVQISGDTFFRFSYVFAEAGDFGIFARATGFNGQTVISAPVDISVVSGEFPAVEITSPADGVSVTAGNNLPLLIQAGDADGPITVVEVFDGTTSLGTAVPTGLAGQYRLNFTPTVSDIGVLNLIARATDDRGNQTDSDVVVVGVVRGQVPQIEILEPAAGAILSVDQPFAVRARVTDGDGIITSVKLTDTNFFFESSQGTISIRPSSQSFFSDVMQNSSETNEFVFIATIENPDTVDMVLTATDDDGNVVQSEIVQFTITAGVVPDATITSPLSGSGPYTRGSVIPVEITASDLDGSVTEVEVFNGATSLGLANLVGANSYRFDYVANAVGLVNLQARATDDRGNLVISNLVTISVVTGVIPTVSIDSPDSSIAVSAYNYGDVIPFEITAYDLDGSISSVSVSYLDNGTPSELGQALSIGNDQYRFFLDSATLPTAGTKYISVVAVDDRGNTSTELVEIQLNVVPFSVEFTTPTAPPYVIKGASDEYFSAERSFTVEVGGIDASTLASLVWQKDGNSAETETLAETLDGSLTYSQTFSFDEVSNLTVTATNTDGVSVQTSLIVYVDLPSPDADRTDFIYFIYNRVRGSIPSAVELQDAIDYINALGGDTTANRATFAAELFPSDEYSNSQYQTVALVYKTLTGQWPTLTQLETGLGIISQDTTVQSRQTVSTQEGSITAGGTETLSFNYSDGDEVTITVTGDGTNANPLTDATLTVRAPDGSFVGFSDDNFLSGNFSLDPVVSFVASQTGAYTATVGGYNSLHSGDFAVTSTSTAIESNTNILAARALVEALKGEYNGSNGFLADADTDSFNLAPSFVAQIYRNKHGVGITTLNSGILGQRLTGIDQDVGNGYILPGYQSDVVNFVANFALDVNLATGPIASIPTSDGYSYSGTLYYGLPNNPLSSWDQARAEIQSDANLSSALSALLGIQNPTATNLAPYAGMTLEQALASIFGSAQFAAQFVGDTTDEDTDLDGVSDYFEILLNADPFDGTVTPTAADSFVTQRMVDLGVVDGDKVTAADDADGDGASNVAEILLNTDPSNITDLPTATGSTSTDGTSFVLEFVRLKPGLTPDGVSVVVECADATFNYEPVADLESKLSLAEDQSEISSDYERVEFRIDMSTQDCSFFRLVVD